MEMLLHDAEEMVALHVADFFAPGDGEDFAFDLEDWGAVCELDGETWRG